MTLPDVLRFCDAFELRPGLVSTREIVDAFKEVKGLFDTPCRLWGSPSDVRQQGHRSNTAKIALLHLSVYSAARL